MTLKLINWCVIFGHKFVEDSGWCQRRNYIIRKPIDFSEVFDIEAL